MESIPQMTMLTHLNIGAPLYVFADLLGRMLDAICGLMSPALLNDSPGLREKLAHLPPLVELGTQEQYTRTTKASVPLKPILPPGAFPALRAVTVSTDLSSARQFLIDYAFISKIRRLNLELDNFDAGPLPSLLKAVSQTCKALQKLVINKRAFVLNTIPLDPLPLPSFTLGALTPILSCPHLTSLEIHHHTCSPDFTEPDLDALAAQVPEIKSLVLNTSSYPPPPPPSSPSAPSPSLPCAIRGSRRSGFTSTPLTTPSSPPATRGPRARAAGSGEFAHRKRRARGGAVPGAGPGCELEATTFDLMSDTWKHVRVLLPGLVKMRVVTTRSVEERLRAGAVAKT